MELLIKKIQTNNRFYIYDVNSNQIIEVEKIFFDLVSSFGKIEKTELIKKFTPGYTNDEISDCLEAIKDAINKVYLSNNRPVEMTFGINTIDSAKKTIGKNMQCLVLELTNRCNNHCKYCQVSGNYSSDVAGRRDMQFAIATKAIDYFIDHNSQEKCPGIVFYGGEPLLKFELLKRCLDYYKEKMENRAISVSLTTNGTIMNHRILNYLSKNRVHLTISLDGPEEFHNRYRKSTEGKDTFNVVLETIKFIKGNDPDYYRNFVSINCVLSPPYHIEKVENFFKEDLFEEIRKRHGIVYCFVDDTLNSFIKDLNLTDNGNTSKSEIVHKLYQQHKDIMVNNQTGEYPVAESLIGSSIQRIARRYLTPLKNVSKPFSNCYIGRRKLFVSTQGNFFMCEKAHKNYCFGNVNEGIDYQKVLDFYTMLDQHAQKCKDCWAQRLCKTCYVEIGNKNKISKVRFDESCARNLKSAENRLRHFCQILEENPSAFA